MKNNILLSLAVLINNLNNKGFTRTALNINDILYKLIQTINIKNDNNGDNQDTDDVSVAVNSIGLRGDTKPEQPMGGMTLEPFFFDSGDLRY